jgi:endo-1,4-beta-xylanase
VEFFVDPNNGKTPGYEDDDGQYRVSFSNRRSVGGNFDGFAVKDNLSSAARVVPGGYPVEASIALNTIRPATGSLLGFEVQVKTRPGAPAPGWPAGSARPASPT